MNTIQYVVAADKGNGWAVFRDGMQIGRRGDLFDAVAFATRFAEREAAATRCRVRVTAERKPARLSRFR